MKFIKAENLKIGMRLARPIYSQKGVLLFDRDSTLTSQTIESVKNFGLLGIYILEPAEPLPPMSEEDKEFERFQTMTVFAIRDELSNILSTRKQQKIQNISDTIIRSYGRQSGKMNFYQNLRSRDDYIYRHAMNVAILCALITRTMKLRREEQEQIIFAAIVHDIGKLSLPEGLAYRNDLNDEQKVQVYTAQLRAGDLIEDALDTAVKRICSQALAAQMETSREDDAVRANLKLNRGAKILLVANRYDELTGMTMEGSAGTEVQALKEFIDHPEIYDPEVVEALVHSVNILFPGVSVELSTGENALVITENPADVLRPVLLCFNDNRILDLSLRANRKIEILDIMKTLDNRYVIDEEALRRAGFGPDGKQN